MSRDNQYLRFHLDIIETLACDADLESMAQKVADLLARGLGAIGGVLFLYDAEHDRLVSWTVTSTNANVRRALKLLDRPFRKYDYDCAHPTNKLVQSFRTLEAVEGNTLADFISPAVRPGIAALMQKTSRVKSIVSKPLVFQGGRIGAVLVTYDRDMKDSDREKLERFSHSVSLVAHNAITVKRLSKRNMQLSALLQVAEDHMDVTQRLAGDGSIGSEGFDEVRAFRSAFTQLKKHIQD